MRTPDKNYQPPKKLIYGIGIALVAIMGGVTYYNYQTHQEDLRKAATMEAARKGTQGRNSPVAQTVAAAPSTVPASTRSVMETIRHDADIELAMKRGWDLINQRDPKSALQAAELFREALRDLDGNLPQFYNGLGRASLIAGKPNDALFAFQKGLALDPTIADMQSGIGWAYWQIGQPYLAKQAWEAALIINPRSPDSWSALAWIYLALGQNAQAKNGFTILMAHNSDDKAAVTGFNMSKSAVQVDLKAIEPFFRLPPLESFTTPPASTSAPTRP